MGNSPGESGGHASARLGGPAGKLSVKASDIRTATPHVPGAGYPTLHVVYLCACPSSLGAASLGMWLRRLEWAIALGLLSHVPEPFVTPCLSVRGATVQERPGLGKAEEYRWNRSV